MTQHDFAAIEELDLEPIKVKLMHEESGEGWSLERANAVEKEYRRFLYLMKKFPKEQTAPLMDVDTFWHYHILDTMKYAVDCDKVFGYFLHHFPYIGLRGEDDEKVHHDLGERMKELYEATFGEAYIREGATAWSGRAPVEANGQAAWSGAATAQGAQTAWSGAATAQSAQTAWSGAATGKPAQTAWSGAATAKSAQTAWSGAATGKSAQTAWSGAATGKSAQTAWSGAATGKSAQTAWSGAATGKPVQTAWSGAATGKPAQTAWSGAATSNVQTAWSGRAPESAESAGGRSAMPAVNPLYTVRPRLTQASA